MSRADKYSEQVTTHMLYTTIKSQPRKYLSLSQCVNQLLSRHLSQWCTNQLLSRHLNQYANQLLSRLLSQYANQLLSRHLSQFNQSSIHLNHHQHLWLHQLPWMSLVDKYSAKVMTHMLYITIGQPSPSFNSLSQRMNQSSIRLNLHMSLSFKRLSQRTYQSFKRLSQRTNQSFKRLSQCTNQLSIRLNHNQHLHPHQLPWMSKVEKYTVKVMIHT